MRMSRIILAAFLAAKGPGVAAFAGPSMIRHTAASTTTSFRFVASGRTKATPLFFSSTAAGGPEARVVDKSQLQDILADYEAKGRDGSGYCVLDVRQPQEIAATGKISPSALNLPLALIEDGQILTKSDDDFEALAGFPKPSPNETLVFSCMAGIRSTRASLAAADAGYTNIINYRGGAKEWFNL